ncbi:MAG: aldehyde dehydrogenase [Mesorhizobium sp.]|nr:aldehyde dehydrogenase [Mesorhizobium sp.]
MADIPQLHHFIDGRDFTAKAGEERLLSNPANEVPLWRMPLATAEIVATAVAAARKAGDAWAALAPTDRASILHRCASQIRSDAEEIARRITLENGKPVTESRVEALITADEIVAVAELATQLRTGKQASQVRSLSFQHARPRGVVACIMPWNYPLLTVLSHVFAALSVGNTVVLKPSEKAPNSVLAPVRAMSKILPDGVLNIVMGDGVAGKELVAHSHVDCVLFVGSQRTGQRVAEECARHLRPSIMELGGKDCFIVDALCDLDRAVPVALECAMRNAGQICTSSERFLVHRSLYQEFADRLAKAAARLQIGPGLEEATQIGPLIDASQLAIVESHVAGSAAAGAEILTGGRREAGQGFFYPPTIVADVPADCALWQDETFGPVAALRPFDDFDEAIAMANEGPYGLGAVLFTDSSRHAMQAMDQLDVGLLKVNTAIGIATGSTWEPAKQSGFGYGNGRELLLSLVHQKSVLWQA